MTAKNESGVKTDEMRQALMDEASRRADENPVILVKLAALLLARGRQANPLGEAMLSSEDVSVPEATDPSMKALSSALLNKVTYIIGTPEKGRPVISDLAYELHRSGRSVLVVSDGPEAVNEELSGIAENLDGVLSEGEPFPVFRLGKYAKGMDRRMTLKNQQQQVGRELYRKQEEVLQERKGLMAKIHAIQEKVDLRLALKETPLARLQQEVHELDSLESEAFKYTAEKERKSEEVASIKRQYPNWQDGAEIENQINKLEREAGRLDHMENGIREKEKELEEFREELARHQNRLELEERRSKLPDTSEQNAVIMALSAKIGELKNDRRGLTEQKEKFQEIIQEFEAKSSLVKLFSSKKSLEDAQANVAKCDEAIESLNLHLEVENKNLAEAEGRLATCEALDKEIAAIETANSKEYCEQRIEFLQNTLETRKRDIPQMETRREELAEEKARLEARMAEDSSPYSRIQELSAQIEEAEEKAGKAAMAAAKKARAIGPKLLKELEKLGESTALLENDSAQAVYHKLAQVHRMLSDELADLDITGCRMKIANLNKSVATADKSLADIESRFGRMDAQTVLDACIIGTTIEELLEDNQQAETLETRRFDTVIIDEAATIPIPALWALAYLASKSLVLVGDMRDSLAPAAVDTDDVEVIRLDEFDETLEEEEPVVEADAEEALEEAEISEAPDASGTSETPEASEAAEASGASETSEVSESPETSESSEAPETSEASEVPSPEPAGEVASAEAELELFNLRATEKPAKDTAKKPAKKEAAETPKAPAESPKAPLAAPARKPEMPVLRAGSITESQRRERARLVAELFGEELVPETRAEEKRMERLEEAEAALAAKESEQVKAETKALAKEAPAEAKALEKEAPAPVEPAAGKSVPAKAEAPAEEAPAMTRVVEPPRTENLKAAEAPKRPEQPEWMRVDIFEYSGMRRCYELGEEVGNLIVLD